MPPKRKKYSARFPTARIKKIMQTDEEIGKVASVVPVIISRALEIFLQSLLSKASDVAEQRSARTLTAQHLKWCIESNKQFDFLVDLAKAVPDVKRGSEAELGDGIAKAERKRKSRKKVGDEGAAKEEGTPRRKTSKMLQRSESAQGSSSAASTVPVSQIPQIVLPPRPSEADEDDDYD
ncbi:dr1-associated corepressor-like [Oscarella lobularis]|uniref:dr1-associated corepressor-like n=1 Tax=Oscarella lobularis TaxID=121494 RepID=UPI0033137F52